MHRINFHAWGLVIALFLVAPAIGAGDPDAPVPKPAVKVGDRWTYRTIDHFTNRTLSEIDHEVTFVGPDAIFVVERPKGGESELDARYTSEWAGVASAIGEVFKTPANILKFPLKVGGKHEAIFETSAVRVGSGRWKAEMTTTVVGWEEVTVPAGKFRALKIEAQGTFQGLDTRYAGIAQRIFWYVPEVKRWVKAYRESRVNNALSLKESLELVDFKVQ
jgi:hypothetical protein